MRRVLFIAYSYPPINTSGVYRSAKFVKYLPQFGWFDDDGAGADCLRVEQK